ncbi:MAG: transposase [Candidatus Poribacteria bacterium]|jgi:hypothetical protein|nr:transposase [Candidatus Poribacteria bacterium]MDP6995772.1 transposase [Candidatus Poribacteria bacterium]
MVVVDGQGFPIDADLDSASAGEIKRLEATIEKVTVPRKGTGRPRQNPVRIIADKGYDSDPLGQRRLKGGIELICPCRKNKQTKKDEGGANCGLAGVDGRLSRLLRGGQTGEDWLLVGKEKFRSSKRSFTLLASSLH